MAAGNEIINILLVSILQYQSVSFYSFHLIEMFPVRLPNFVFNIIARKEKKNQNNVYYVVKDSALTKLILLNVIDYGIRITVRKLNLGCELSAIILSAWLSPGSHMSSKSVSLLSI